MAFSGATHDIAGDGLYMDTLDPAKQSRYIGWQGAAYNVAKVLQADLLYIWLAFWKSIGSNSGMDCYYAYLWRNYAAYWSVQYKTASIRKGS